MVSAIMALLSLILTELYFSSFRVVEHGSARTQAQQLCRETLNRIAPIIVGAAPPNDTQVAVYLPEVAATGSELWFYSPDDLFGNTPYDPRNPTFYFYRIRHSGATAVLEKLQMNGTPLAAPPPRVLARQLTGLQFERIDSNLVRVRVSARTTVLGATHQQRTVESDLQTTVSLPNP